MSLVPIIGIACGVAGFVGSAALGRWDTACWALTSAVWAFGAGLR